MSTVIRVAAEAAEGSESTNFLVPDGTFFVILAIFLVVLAVIGAFVVPPIMKVLRERDDMATRTLNDNKQSAEQFAAADADYEEKVSKARQEASAARDNARAEGRGVIEEKRSQADAEVASLLDGAATRLKGEGDALADELRRRVDNLSATLASRILGVDVSGTDVAAGRK